jgi:hypothetical protein
MSSPSSALARASMTEVISPSAGPPCGGLYLMPPSVGAVVRRRDDEAVGPPFGVRSVEGDDGPGHGGGRGVGVGGAGEDLDVVRGEDLEGGAPRRLGERVGVLADEERTRDAGLRAPLDRRLHDGGDVRLVEAVREGRATMARGAEGDALRRLRGVGPPGVVVGDEPAEVDEVGELGRLPGPR